MGAENKINDQKSGGGGELFNIFLFLQSFVYFNQI